MTKSIAKSRKAFTRGRERSILGLSMIRLSGFRICQIVDRESSKVPLVKRKTLEELFFLRNIK